MVTFCLKIGLRALSTELTMVLTSTHNLSSEAKKKKKKKKGLPLQTPESYRKVGFKGSSLHGHAFLMHISSKHFDKKQKFKI